MTTFSTMVRRVGTAALIWAAVWLDSKWAMTFVLVGLAVANELGHRPVPRDQ